MEVQVIDLEKTIQKNTVLKSINLTLSGGHIYGLRGKNGCGKTMLMRCIAGLIRPTKGYILINGKRLHKQLDFPPDTGILLENPSFLDSFTGYENLELLAGIQKNINKIQIQNTLQIVGLNPDDKRKYKKYSLGMKQRLGIAGAILGEPELILLDEPINAIDEDGVEEIRQVLLELKNKRKLIIVACHDREELELLADTVFVMSQGEVVDCYEKADSL